MMSYDQVLSEANKAISRGATRICLGAAWREVKDNKPFEEFLKMIQGIAELGIEVCCTLGMLEDTQAQRLKEAGLYAYNHNLDTSENFYPTIITTRTYQDRLRTLDIVQKAGLSVCCGGIIGLGETVLDRLELLLTLSKLNPHPDSVPINQLSAVPGTPLADQPRLSIWEVVRIIAVTRIVFPLAMVRLSCGRAWMTEEQHALCFIAGANSLFLGDKLLTVPNSNSDGDERLFSLLGLKKKVFLR
jgi:biotin synthase